MNMEQTITILFLCFGLSFGSSKSTGLTVGVSGGMIGEYSKERKGLVGGEVSIFGLSETLHVQPWVGLYSHALWGENRKDFSIGPEVGLTWIGITGGYLHRADNGIIREGASLRLHFSFVYLHPYIMVKYLDKREVYGGIAVKFPIIIYADDEFYFDPIVLW